ncbi:AlpA family transcriptional regulator [Aeromicrobium sp. Leaf350]|uniref:helix-turn-helix transcriptional regulator n=1 Tax=Aeromicrobium sp. Leaf350 TaxID=2876565 RepID=UPI001E591026|nr:helix-turn-helix domain-containing protein [Aeromicrobium sp. Leaf350]
MTEPMIEQLLSPGYLAEHLGVSEGQLAQMRYLGTGPTYVKVGTRVRYALADVEEWLRGHRRTQTSG